MCAMSSVSPNPPRLSHLLDRIAGVDEVGRGCLAGPVFAAAVILPQGSRIEGLDDSKKLSARQREQVAQRIREQALAWAIGHAEVAEVDALNILRATFLAMQRALAQLDPPPSECWIDGNQRPPLDLPLRLIVGGDAVEPCIMAASVLAKVARDAHMVRLDAEHPGYGLAQHKGYGTPAHLAALRRLGPSALHRMSFAPCAQAAEPASRLTTYAA